MMKRGAVQEIRTSSKQIGRYAIRRNYAVAVPVGTHASRKQSCWQFAEIAPERSEVHLNPRQSTTGGVDASRMQYILRCYTLLILRADLRCAAPFPQLLQRQAVQID